MSEKTQPIDNPPPYNPYPAQQPAPPPPGYAAPQQYPAQQPAPPPPGYAAPQQYPAQKPAPPQSGYAAPQQTGYAAPPPAGYNQPHQQNQTVVITTQQRPSVVMLGEYPAHMTCPQCNANIVTRVDYQIGTMVWLVAGVMILFGLWLGCCLIPFCIDSLKDVAHYCPNCNRHLGTKQRLS